MIENKMPSLETARQTQESMDLNTNNGLSHCSPLILGQYREKVNKKKLELRVEYTPETNVFPIEVLNEKYQRVVTEIAAAYTVPKVVPACAFLSLAGACIGRTRAIEIKGSWKEHPNLWIVLVGESGTGKSPATRKIQDPVFDLEGEWYQTYLEEKKAYDFELEQRRARSRPERASLGPPPNPPIRKQLIVDDSTPEALGDALRDNPRGILWVRDELAGFILDMDKYTKNGGTKQRLISAYDSGPWKTNRVSKHSFIRHACLSIFGTIQPAAIPAIFSDLDAATGFLPRFTFVRVEQNTPAFWSDETVSDKSRRVLEETYKALLALEFQKGDKPQIVPVSDKAKALFVEWFNKQAEEPWQDAELGLYQAVLAKLKSQCLRIGLILHCLDAVAGGSSELEPVSLDTMQRAVIVAGFFKENQKAIWRQVVRRKQLLSLNPIQKRVARAVISLASEIKDNMLPTARITELANENIAPYEKRLSEKSVGKILSGLGFGLNHLPGRPIRGPIITEELLEKLKLSLNLNGLNGLNG